MAGTRALRSTSKSSPASAKSTPKARLSRNSGGASGGSKSASTTGKAKGKTSPYFNKTASSPLVKGAPRAARNGAKAISKASESTKSKGKGKGKAEKVARVEYSSATGLTETSDEEESESEQEVSEDDFDPSDAEVVEEEEEEEEVDSDEIDEVSSEEEESEDDRRKKGKKRKSLGGGKAVQSSTNGSAKKPKWKLEEEEGYAGIELEEGQEIAGRIYPAPKTGQVPPGRISKNTFDFLANLQIPERNDRDWFKSHEPSFRQAEKEWKDFVGILQEKLHGADDEIPILPPRDIIHRIYRDVRFSSDKTPYKKSFSLSTSRGGRKGIWAGYYLSISPNGNTRLAAGVWAPDKDSIANIRQSITSDPRAFRDIIGKPEFVKLFGPAKEHPKGKRQNVFGHDDALKYAPKGVDKAHKDIDLLKLRSVAVMLSCVPAECLGLKHRFEDEEVIAKDFQEKIKEIVAVMAPFVHKLNDMIALPADNDDDAGHEENDEDEEE